MEKMLTYLKGLEDNNNRQWYHSNKETYKLAENEFLELIQSLINEIRLFDDTIIYNNPKDLTYKLVRDTRYSYDKSPYNPSFRCSITSKGKVPIPTGYYLCIKPNNQSFIGGGLFTDMFREATLLIREYIFNNKVEFLKIINDEKFKENFSVMGSSLKNVPKEYPKDDIISEYLKNKSWYIEYRIKDNQFKNKEEFISFILEKYKIMKPFKDFLNCALKGFELPKRG